MVPKIGLELVVEKTYNLEEDRLPIHSQVYRSVDEKPKAKTAKDKDARKDYERLARLDLENEPED